MSDEEVQELCTECDTDHEIPFFLISQETYKMKCKFCKMQLGCFEKARNKLAWDGCNKHLRMYQHIGIEAVVALPSNQRAANQDGYFLFRGWIHLFGGY